MTVSPIENAKSAQKAAPLLTMNGQALWRAVSNTMLFASPLSADLPALHAVRFERDTDGKLNLVSCDRYRICIETVEHQSSVEGAAFAFSLPLPDCKQLATVLKAAGRLGDVTLVVEEDRLRVDVLGSEMTLRFPADYSFPPYRSLIPKEESMADVSAIALNPKYLSDLGKLKFASGGANGNPMRLQFFGMNKPVLMTFTDGPTVLQMPVRLPEPAEQTPAAEEETADAA